MRLAVASLVACATAAFASTSARSADSHFYAGVAVGQSSVDSRAKAESTITLSPVLPSAISINSIPFDDDDTSWSAFAGYWATPHVGVELGYTDHGTFRTRFGGSDPAKLGIRELSLGANLRYPVTDRFAFTAGAGISRAQFDVDGSVLVLIFGPPSTFPIRPVEPPFGILPPGIVLPGGVETRPLATPKDETGGYWKVGLNWRFSNTIEAGLSYGKSEVQVVPVESLRLSLSYAF